METDRTTADRASSKCTSNAVYYRLECVLRQRTQQHGSSSSLGPGDVGEGREKEEEDEEVQHVVGKRFSEFVSLHKQLQVRKVPLLNCARMCMFYLNQMHVLGLQAPARRGGGGGGRIYSVPNDESGRALPPLPSKILNKGAFPNSRQYAHQKCR